MTLCTLSYQVAAVDEDCRYAFGGLRQRKIFNSHWSISAVIPE
ncbi:hypothetical protein [Nostoc commune]|nr:hypothetical protein [Nostoc commune]